MAQVDLRSLTEGLLRGVLQRLGGGLEASVLGLFSEFGGLRLRN